MLCAELYVDSSFKIFTCKLQLALKKRKKKLGVAFFIEAIYGNMPVTNFSQIVAVYK